MALVGFFRRGHLWVGLFGFFCKGSYFGFVLWMFLFYFGFCSSI